MVALDGLKQSGLLSVHRLSLCRFTRFVAPLPPRASFLRSCSKRCMIAALLDVMTTMSSSWRGSLAYQCPSRKVRNSSALVRSGARATFSSVDLVILRYLVGCRISRLSYDISNCRHRQEQWLWLSLLTTFTVRIYKYCNLQVG